MVREACASRYEIFVEVEGVLSTSSGDDSSTTSARAARCRVGVIGTDFGACSIA